MKIKKWNKSSTEDRDEILRAYFFGFHQKTISDSAGQPIAELSLEEMRQAYGNLIIDNIDSIEYKPSTVVTRLFSFIFTHLGKYTPTKEEGVKMVVAKNMPRNFNKLENSFFEISVDVIIEYYQIVMTNTLTKEASDNYDLDLMNLFKKYGGAEGFKFDDKLSHYSI